MRIAQWVSGLGLGAGGDGCQRWRNLFRSTLLASRSGSGELILISQHCLAQAFGWAPGPSRDAMLLELQRNQGVGNIRGRDK